MDRVFGVLGFGVPVVLIAIGALEFWLRRRLYPRFGRRYDPRVEGAALVLTGIFSLTIFATWAWAWPAWTPLVAWLPLAASSVVMLRRGPIDGPPRGAPPDTRP